MRYIPSVTYQQNKKDFAQTAQNKKEELTRAVDMMYTLPRNPISDTTSFIITSTTIDTSKMDNRFDSRNALKLLAIDKFSSLAALQPIDESILTYLWQDLKYAINFEFWDRAEDKALEIDNLLCLSRGRAGQYNFSEQLITQREVLISKHKQEVEESKKAGINNWFRRRQSTPQETQMLTGQPPGGNQ